MGEEGRWYLTVDISLLCSFLLCACLNPPFRAASQYVDMRGSMFSLRVGELPDIHD